MHNTFIFRSAPSPEDASIEEIRKVCDLLMKQGELRVAYRLDAPNRVTDDDMVIDLSTRALKYRIEPFGLNVEIGPPTVVGREFNGNFLDVHVTLESNVIRFTEAPWHPDNLYGGKEFHRLLEATQRSKPFTATYQFLAGGRDSAEVRMRFAGQLDHELHDALRLIKRDGYSARLIRQEWPIASGPYRLDFRIEPWVTCDQCKRVTAWNGTAYVCVNCGNTVEPK